ncbi:MAG TPA: HDOD domain-containing protein, partial [Polyangiaceae bacterium]
MLLASLLQKAESEGLDDFSPQHFRTYALRAARLAERFAIDRSRAQEAFVAGLLHDVGELLFAVRDSARLATVAAVVGEGQRKAADVERDYFGSSHAQAGAALLARWGFSTAIVDAVALHHSPRDRRAADVELLAVVHAVASHLEPRGSAKPRLDEAFLAEAGLGNHVARWSAVAASESEEPAP